ncbi:MAG: DEAD/DEAH box helicase [Nakamurella sp.]
MPETSFAALGVPAQLIAVLAADGKATPFPIQADTLPDTLAGRDVLGRGKTGSGKTLAFCLPMAVRLGASRAKSQRRSGRPLGLILAPTRELATQIEAVLSPLAAAYGLTTTTIFGGVKQGRQVTALKRGIDVVIGCPGRIEDLMQQGFLSLDSVEITVLDEADHMADLGFLKVVTRILEKTPRHGQRMLFSATLDNGVDKIVNRFMTDPVHHSVDDANSPVAAMKHHVFEVATAEDKDDLVSALASGMGKRILFTRTKHHAKKLAKRLTAAGIPSVDLHGNLSQPRRDQNLAAFKSDAVRVLVATDVAARGVDIDDVELVVHVDPPMEHKAYLHRSGRTARAGKAGEVVTICMPGERRDLADLLRKAKITVTPTRVTARAAVVTQLVGEVAPYVKPQPLAADTAQHGASAGGARRGNSPRGRTGSAEGANGRGRREARPERDGSSARPRARQTARPTSATAGRGVSSARSAASPAGSRTAASVSASGGRGRRSR